MHATVTTFTVDFRGSDFDDAQEAFERHVVPELRKQNGYEGSYFLRTNRGQGMIVCLWEDEAAAQANESGGLFAERMEPLTPFFEKAPREAQRFIVGFADHPMGSDD